MPSWNFTPLITSASNLNPLSLRQFDSAVFINLKAIASVVFRLPQLFVLWVLSLTVANIDSIGFVVRTCELSSNLVYGFKSNVLLVFLGFANAILEFHSLDNVRQ